MKKILLRRGTKKNGPFFNGATATPLLKQTLLYSLMCVCVRACVCVCEHER